MTRVMHALRVGIGRGAACCAPVYTKTLSSRRRPLSRRRAFCVPGCVRMTRDLLLLFPGNKKNCHPLCIVFTR